METYVHHFVFNGISPISKFSQKSYDMGTQGNKKDEGWNNTGTSLKLHKPDLAWRADVKTSFHRNCQQQFRGMCSHETQL